MAKNKITNIRSTTIMGIRVLFAIRCLEIMGGAE